MFENVIAAHGQRRMKAAVAADDDQGDGGGGKLLVVAYEATVLDDPGEGPLDDSAAEQDLKAIRRRVASDDLQGDVSFAWPS